MVRAIDFFCIHFLQGGVGRESLYDQQWPSLLKTLGVCHQSKQPLVTSMAQSVVSEVRFAKVDWINPPQPVALGC